MDDVYTLADVEDTFREGYEAALEALADTVRESSYESIHSEALIILLEHMMGYTEPDDALTTREMLDILDVETPEIYYTVR